MDKKSRWMALGMGSGALLLFGGYTGWTGLQNMLEGQNNTGNIALFVVGSAIAMLGLIGIVAVLIDTMAFKAVVEVLDEVTEDEREALEDGYVSPSLVEMGTTLILAIIVVGFVLRYHKLSAVWYAWDFPIPVMLVTVLAMGIVTAIVMNMEWYRDITVDIPGWVYWVGVICLVTSLWLGLKYQEHAPWLNNGMVYEQTGNVYVNNSYYGSSESVALDFGDSDTDWMKDAGAAICIIGFIIVCILLVVGSWFIQSFWVLSAGVLLNALWLIAWQSLQVAPERRVVSQFSRRRSRQSY